MMRRLEAPVVGTLIVLALIGATVRILALPVATQAMFRVSGSGADSGLEPETALETAQAVRAYVVGGERSLPARVQDREGFTADAVTHLDDVRRVFSAGMWATALCALAAAVWGFARIRGGRVDLVRQAALWAGGEAVAVVLLAAAVGLVDFDRFFAGFHALFFEAGTWQFPEGDLLIQLFPEPFWALAGGLWGAVIALGGVTLLVYGIGGRSQSSNASRPIKA